MNLWLIPLLPMAGAIINGLFWRRFSKNVVSAIGLAFPGAAMLWAWKAALQFAQLPAGAIPHIENYGPWLSAGDFVINYGLYLDHQSSPGQNCSRSQIRRSMRLRLLLARALSATLRQPPITFARIAT